MCLLRTGVGKLFDLIFSIVEFIASVLGGVILIFVYVVPWFLGLFLLYVGLRFRKSAHEAGVELDISAFWGNWLIWVWMWAERAKEIVLAMPFFQKDLSENMGVKQDDGKV